jgi:hypothetical protein
MILYRVAQNSQPDAADFLSQGAQGRRCPDPKFEREWNEGISVFDDLDHAIDKARRAPALGRYVVTLDIPPDSGVEFQQTFRDRHHYTIYAQGERLLQYVVGSPIPVERQV